MSSDLSTTGRRRLTLILLTWRLWWAPNNASRWQIGFNLAFKVLKKLPLQRLHLIPTQRKTISIVQPTRRNNVSNLFYCGMTLYMFRKVFPSVVRSSRVYIQQHAFVKQILLSACWQSAVSIWRMPVAVCAVSNSWWRTERPSETCRVLLQIK